MIVFNLRPPSDRLASVPQETRDINQNHRVSYRAVIFDFMTARQIVPFQLKLQIHTVLDRELDSGQHLFVLIALRLRLARRVADVELLVDERAAILCHLARDLLDLVPLETDIHLP
jgi:hypothetical protein